MACVLLLLVTVPTHGYIIAGKQGADGTGYSEAELANTMPDFAYWGNVVYIQGGTGIYLGFDQTANSGYVLTANHLGALSVGSSSVTIAGTNYLVSSSERIGSTDLRLYTVDTSNADDALLSLLTVSIADYNPAVDEALLMMGRGSRVEGTDDNALTSDMVADSGFDVYHWGSAGGINWALNQVADVPIWLGSGSTATWTNSATGATQSAFFTVFDDPGAGNYNTSLEGAGARGDSGGPAFVKRNGQWQLAGIASSVLSYNSQPANTSAFGNRTTYANVAEYSEQLPELWEVSSQIPEPGSSLMLVIGLGGFLTRRHRA